MYNDLRYAFRMLRKNPGFASVAILTLALGIGANSAIFSVVNGVLLKPLAYHEPERIVTLLHDGRRPVAPADFLDWRTQSQTVERMSAAEAWGGILAGQERPESIVGLRVGEGLFQLLGVAPALGRTFDAQDFRPGQDQVVVLSHSLWERRFGGDKAVLGRSVTLNSQSYAVIGVMPPQFQFAPFWVTKAEMWSPRQLAQRATSRTGSSLRVFARLRPGVVLAQAQAEMDGICKRLEQDYPDTNTGRTVRVDPLLEKVVGNIRPALQVLAGAVLFVLLIACANVANLLLVRATARRKELAVRAALGAGRARTVRQLLAESLVIALLASVLGLLIGVWGVDSIKLLLEGDSTLAQMRLPRLKEISVDGVTLLFTLGVALLTGFVFGLFPALQAASPRLQDALKESGRGTTQDRGGRMRSALVVAEIALALMTLASAGLMLRSFGRLAAIDPGFDVRNVLAMYVSLTGQQDLTGERREVFYQQVLEQIRRLPGVESASAINHLPLAGDIWNFGISIEGRPALPRGQGISAVYRVCRPNYFGTMGLTLVRGRDFNPQDAAAAPGVVIINERLASRHWPDGDPLGKRITFDDPNGTPRWMTVVGIVENAKQNSWVDEADIETYIPFQQSGGFFDQPSGQYASMTVVVRTRTNPLALAGILPGAVRSVNASVPVSSVASLEQIVANAVWQPRFNLIVIGLFAGLALALAAVGIYGVIAYSVKQRTQEIGIRMTLGAQRRDVLRLVVGQGMKLALAGVALGLAGALALAHVLAKLLFQTKPTDPMTLAGVVLVLVGVAFLACYLPARRASRVDPMVALRYE